jgi:Cytochrome c oxidase subunit IV
MKVEWRTVLGASLFLGATGVVYWVLKNHPTETSGVVMLIFGFAAYAMLFGYLLLQYVRRERIPRPEDRFDATNADGEGEVGYFPSASMWPAGMGVGMVFAMVGLIFGWWWLIIGGIFFFGSVIGWIAESEAAGDVPMTFAEEDIAAAAGHPGSLEDHGDYVEPVPSSLGHGGGYGGHGPASDAPAEDH